MRKNHYPLADCPTMEERPANVTQRNLRCEATGEFRAPKKGEWYLSGAIIEGYKAPLDLSTPFHIARLIVWPDPERFALEAFVATVEATGGVMNIAVDDRPYLVPVADEQWADLADAYLAACKALDRLPKIDDSPNPFAIQPKSQKRQEEKPVSISDALLRERCAEQAPRILALLRHYVCVINTSDDTHPDFEDSCADTVQELWMREAETKLLLARLETGREP